MRRFLLRGAFITLSAGLAVSACASASAPATKGPSLGSASQSFANIGYSNWSDADPPYRFYPGDEVSIVSVSDSTLSRDVTVAPDGRISMPWVAPLMVTGRSVDDVQTDLASAYRAAGMKAPNFQITVKTAQPVKVYVGGEVAQPGEYAMSGDINAMQAVIQAGSFKTSAKSGKVVIIRRGQDGTMMQRVVDLSSPSASRDLVPLRRGDIVFVPKTSVAEVGTWMGQVRDALPIQFGYNINGL